MPPDRLVGDDVGVPPRVVAVNRDGEHRFSKASADVVTLVAGHGVAGDAHAGELVQHRSRVAADPTQPNLRQAPPCAQIDAFRPGLLQRVVHRATDGSVVRRAGVMGVVTTGGDVAMGAPIAVELPAHPHRPLDRV